MAEVEAKAKDATVGDEAAILEAKAKREAALENERAKLLLGQKQMKAWVKDRRKYHAANPNFEFRPRPDVNAEKRQLTNNLDLVTVGNRDALRQKAMTPLMKQELATGAVNVEAWRVAQRLARDGQY
ncbi:hypothetical protein MKZ38_007870 [Zalerion maritima]|uniref:Uncharacterized protein n=1 Tax=Zalerion maritima TaxID=339359 RepID=A0AAD5RUQ9_9PEZI|nr:hypothetical protein MKZ38_007870 [Zalerion maritima]